MAGEDFLSGGVIEGATDIGPVGSSSTGGSLAGTPFGTFAPKDDDERVGRKGAWKTFLQRISTDEKLRAQFFTIGTELLKPIQPGQTAKGNIAGALQAGERARQGVGEKARTAGLEERTVSAREETARAATTRAEATKRAARGGGTAAKVQQNNQIRNALLSSNPGKYPKTPAGRAKATLDARKIVSSKSREELIIGLTGKMILPNQDPSDVVGKATQIVDSALGASEAPSPLPATKEELVDGKLYNTSRGTGRWNATTGVFDPS